jgi:hypothetical protein
MPVMRAQAHEDADVVHERRHLEQEPIAAGQLVFVLQLIEKPRRELRDMLAVRRS